MGHQRLVQCELHFSESVTWKKWRGSAEFFVQESAESPSFCDRDFCDRGAHKSLRAHRQGEAPICWRRLGRAVWRNVPVKSHQVRGLSYTKGGEGVSRSGISTQAHGEVGVSWTHAAKSEWRTKSWGGYRPPSQRAFLEQCSPKMSIPLEPSLLIYLGEEEVKT